MIVLSSKGYLLVDMSNLEGNHQKLKLLKDALVCQEEAAKTAPHDGIILSNLAKALCGYAKEKNVLTQESIYFKRAEKCYERSLKFKPNIPSTWIDRALLYQAVGDYDKALEYFNEGLRLKPEHTVGLECRAKLLMEQGETEKAIIDISNAIIVIESTNHPLPAESQRLERLKQMQTENTSKI